MGAASSVPVAAGAVEGATDTPDGSNSPEAEARTTRTTRSHLLILSRAHNKFSINLFLVSSHFYWVIRLCYNFQTITHTDASYGNTQTNYIH